MVVIICPIHEFNHCHNPSGVGGGEFCSAGPWASSSSRVLTARRATVGAMRPATAKDRARLVIPPAYVDAMVSTDPKAEVRGTAVDAKGQIHRYYAASYANRQQQAKWTRVVAFQKGIGALAAKVEKATQTPGKPGYNEAMTIRLILQTGLRNGGEAKGEHDSFGASSLRMEHVALSGDTLTLTFPGKGGHAQDHVVTDATLARYVRERRADGSETLFPHTADDTYAYMQTLTRGTFKVHDIRTWYGTVYADRLTQEALAQGLRPKTAKEFKAFTKAIATKVSGALGNTPAVALKNYIHPAVLKGLAP